MFYVYKKDPGEIFKIKIFQYGPAGSKIFFFIKRE